MRKRIGCKNGPQFKIDPDLSTESKMKALSTGDMNSLLEQWGNGEIVTEDVQVMLLSFQLSWMALATHAPQASKIIRPGH